MQYLATSNERCEMTTKSIVLAVDNALSYFFRDDYKVCFVSQ